MVEGEELGAIARRVIDSNQFMTIGTADEERVRWVSPVWDAPAEYREFFWVSDPEARHSGHHSGAASRGEGQGGHASRVPDPVPTIPAVLQHAGSFVRRGSCDQWRHRSSRRLSGVSDRN
jgi:hypothetical protein